MIDVRSYYKPNFDEIAAKVIDGEAIIMNFSNGLYFSTTGLGAAIWTCIEAGWSTANIVNAIAAQYDEDLDRVAMDVNDLMAALLAESLIVEVPTDESGEEKALPVLEKPKPYVRPELAKHEDMAELLALDPPMPGIAETGWRPDKGA
jgi:hypothetical protein